MCYKNSLYLLVLLMLLALFISSCGERTVVTIFGNLTGYVILDDEDLFDYSGITIELYKPVKLDTTIVRLNQEYPHIGVHISQETEFDHRLHNPSNYTNSNGNGLFEFSNIPVGQYHLVIFKRDWGYRYWYNIPIVEGDNYISSSSEPLVLYPEISLDNHIHDEVILQSNRHYIFEQITTFYPGSHLIIQPDTVIRINPGIRVIIIGELTIEREEGKYFRVTSNDGFFPPSSNIGNYTEFKIEPTAIVLDNIISNGIFTFGNNNLVVHADNIEVTNSIFSGHIGGCSFEQTENIAARNIIFRNTTLTGQAGLNLEYVNQGSIQKSIFVNNDIGMIAMSSNDIEIKNSYFVNNASRGFLNWYDSDSLVLNSIFDNNVDGVANGHRSYIDVKYCVFNSDVGINSFHTGHWSYTTANFNNFYCTDYAVISRANFSSGSGMRYMDVTNNYWGTTVSSEIKELIWDWRNEDELDPSYDRFLSELVYQPYLNQKYAGAGIQMD